MILGWPPKPEYANVKRGTTQGNKYGYKAAKRVSHIFNLMHTGVEYKIMWSREAELMGGGGSLGVVIQTIVIHINGGKQSKSLHSERRKHVESKDFRSSLTVPFSNHGQG